MKEEIDKRNGMRWCEAELERVEPLYARCTLFRDYERGKGGMEGHK